MLIPLVYWYWQPVLFGVLQESEMGLLLHFYT